MFEFQYKTVDSAESSIKLHYFIFFRLQTIKQSGNGAKNSGESFSTLNVWWKSMTEASACKTQRQRRKQ